MACIRVLGFLALLGFAGCQAYAEAQRGWARTISPEYRAYEAQQQGKCACPTGPQQQRGQCLCAASPR